MALFQVFRSYRVQLYRWITNSTQHSFRSIWMPVRLGVQAFSRTSLPSSPPAPHHEWETTGCTLAGLWCTWLDSLMRWIVANTTVLLFPRNDEHSINIARSGGPCGDMNKTFGFFFSFKLDAIYQLGLRPHKQFHLISPLMFSLCLP